MPSNVPVADAPRESESGRPSSTGKASDIVRAARKGLRKQTRKLLRRLKKCADNIDSAETVHKLRISTRRVDAALRTFAPLLPAKPSRKLRKQVRDCRRAAGDVRDLDVLIERLADDKSLLERLPLLCELRTRRLRAADDLAKTIEKRSSSIKRRSRQVSERVRSRKLPDGKGAEDLAGELVQPLLDRFCTAAAADLTSEERLHDLRKRGKQLRYSLELLQEIGPIDRFRPLERLLKQLQDRLGMLNDRVTAESLLGEVASATDDAAARASAESLGSAERERIEKARPRFLEWWLSTGREELNNALAESAPTAACDSNGQPG